jgi:hypothetical protein
MYILCYKPVNMGDIFLLYAKNWHDYNSLDNTEKIKLKFPTYLIRHHAMKACGGVAQEGEEPVSLPGSSTPGEISNGTH